MKRLITLFTLLLLSFGFAAQEVESIVEFELNSVIGGGDRIRILDANDDYVIVRVRSNDFSMSNGFTFQNPEASEVLQFVLTARENPMSVCFRAKHLVVGSDSIDPGKVFMIVMGFYKKADKHFNLKIEKISPSLEKIQQSLRKLTAQWAHEY